MSGEEAEREMLETISWGEPPLCRCFLWGAHPYRLVDDLEDLCRGKEVLEYLPTTYAREASCLQCDGILTKLVGGVGAIDSLYARLV